MLPQPPPPRVTQTLSWGSMTRMPGTLFGMGIGNSTMFTDSPGAVGDDARLSTAEISDADGLPTMTMPYMCGWISQFVLMTASPSNVCDQLSPGLSGPERESPFSVTT